MSGNNQRANYYQLPATGRKRLREETEDWNQLVATIGAALKAERGEV